jgi:hypothetical protein
MTGDMVGLINFALRVFPVAESPVANDYGFFIVVVGGKCGRKCDYCRRRTIVVFYDVDLFPVRLDAANKELLLFPTMSIYSQSSWMWLMVGRGGGYIGLRLLTLIDLLLLVWTNCYGGIAGVLEVASRCGSVDFL